MTAHLRWRYQTVPGAANEDVALSRVNEMMSQPHLGGRLDCGLLRLATIVLSSLHLASDAGAQVEQHSCSRLYLEVEEITPPPLQYQDFCDAFPGDCRMIGTPVLDWNEELVHLLERINREVNAAIAFMPDPEWWGEEERWSYPVHGHGDCEDVALEKRKALVSIGLPRAAMTMAIVHHVEKPSNHAVLLVETTGGTWVLDSLVDEVLCWNRAGLNYESRERVDGQWERYDQSSWHRSSR